MRKIKWLLSLILILGLVLNSICSAAYTIVLAAVEDTTLTPLFDFPSGTIECEIDDVSQGNLTSGVAGSFAVTTGQKVEYICSDWDAITKIDIGEDKVSGDISGWTLPSSLTYFRTSNTSVSGDISGWTLPSGLTYFYVYNTSVSGDISGWTLPSSLTYFYVSNTSVSGDISGWTLPSGLTYFCVYNTSIDYDSSAGAFMGVTDSLTKIDFDNCALAWQQVDNALADLVTSGIDNGVSAKTIEIGDDNSAPSIAGLIHKETLETSGWTVKVTAGTAGQQRLTLINEMGY